MRGIEPVHQEFVSHLTKENTHAEMVGDVEYIEYNQTTQLYESNFGPDLPEDYTRPLAYNSVTVRDGIIYLVAKTPEPLEYATRLLELDKKFKRWILVDNPLTPRTNATVFTFQDKIYVIGGYWQNPSVATKTDAPIKHDIVYFNDKKVYNVRSILQEQIQQDRYSYFIYPPGEWALWGPWLPCDATCGGGVIMRKRPCVSMFAQLVDQARYGCGPLPEETKPCNTHKCPSWSNWNNWNDCTSTCGHEGVQYRKRKCKHGNLEDIGCHDIEENVGNVNITSQVQDCNRHFCPPVTTSEIWEPWSECTKSCAGGLRIRARRKCQKYKEPKTSENNKDDKKAKDKSRGRRQTFDDLRWLLKPESPTTESPTLALGNATDPEMQDEIISNYNITLLSEEKCELPDYWRIVNQTETCNEQKCPSWTKWLDWEDCSETCGTNGTQIRRRECKNGIIGDFACPEKEDMETQQCNRIICPYFDEWSDWSDCPVTCGGDFFSRTRDCLNGTIGEMGCDDPSTEKLACGTEPCPIYWSEWTNWSECSAYCGDGEISRTRECLNALNETSCGGEGSEDIEICNDGFCSDGYFAPEWSLWGEWEECSTTCGKGVATRYRNCTGDSIGSRNCPYDSNIEYGFCESIGCPLWSIWNSWNDCSLDCTDPVNIERYLVGTRNRTRDCMVCPYDEFVCRKPYNSTICDSLYEEDPDGGGQILPCKCNDLLEKPIDNDIDNTEGSGSGGGEDEPDTVESTDGVSYSAYVHDMLEGYKEVEENFTDVIRIIANPELSNANWGLWSEWGKCSETCGKGTRTRYRGCLSGDIDDPGCGFKGSYQDKECLIRVCRPEWQIWEQWTSCTATCGPGVRSRIRYCNSEKKLGHPGCKVENRGETIACIMEECIKWRPWEQWSPCSASCGQGLQARSRICDSDKARHCPGPNVEPRDCFVPESECQKNIHTETWLPAEMLDFGINMDEFVPPDLDYFSPSDYFLATTAPVLYYETTPYNMQFFTTGAVEDDSVFGTDTGYWGEWEEWSPCSLTCTDPFSRKLRRRKCINGSTGSSSCPFIDEVRYKYFYSVCLHNSKKGWNGT